MRTIDTQGRLQALKKLLSSEQSSTQDELKSALEKLDFELNQSTISRDFRRLGAVKLSDPSGRTVYQLSENVVPDMAPVPTEVPGMITDILNSGHMSVSHLSHG